MRGRGKHAQYGQTALLVAVKQDRLSIARLLLERGADVEAKTKVRAARSGRCRLAWSLVAMALQPARLSVTCGVTTAPQAGWTALTLCAQHGGIELARLLLDHGADPTARTSVRQRQCLHRGGRGAAARRPGLRPCSSSCSPSHLRWPLWKPSVTAERLDTAHSVCSARSRSYCQASA